MGLLHHASRTEGEYLTHFHVGHGSGWAALAWDLRDEGPRDVMVLRSDRAFAEQSADPSADPQQTLVYRGVEREVKVMDAGLANDIAYHYSVFCMDDQGVWHAEVRTTVALRERRIGSAPVWKMTAMACAGGPS